MIAKEPLLVIFVKMIDRIPYPASETKRKRGRQETYTERLILKALVIMIIRRLYSAYSLLAFLEQETEVTKQLREQLTENGRFPSRRTLKIRFAALCTARSYEQFWGLIRPQAAITLGGRPGGTLLNWT